MDQESCERAEAAALPEPEPEPEPTKAQGVGKKRRSKQQRRSSSEGGAGSKKKNGEKEYRLVSYEELPEYMKENEFILNYYRSEWPVLNAALSLFSWHNETINIWTHLVGFMVFLGLTVWHLAQYFPQVAHLIGHLSWPISKVAENVSSNIGDAISVSS